MSSAKPLEKYWAGAREVMPLSAGQDKIGTLDLSESNGGLTAAIFADVDAFSRYIGDRIRSGGYRYLAGGYGELRKIYSFSPLFDGEEPRRLHLGVDIWGPAGTPVFTPVPGYVHSAAWNGAKGDYGGTVILAHDGWFALYGHLDKASVERAAPGRGLDAGSPVGALGEPRENGHWPPHLHFQVILDLEGHTGDYPGVCRWSERERYLRNCPDPEGILRLGRFQGRNPVSRS